MNNTELIEKLAVIMDRLDRIERKIDELNKKNDTTITLPTITPPTVTPATYPQPMPIWYDDKKIYVDKITCTGDDYKLY